MNFASSNILLLFPTMAALQRLELLLLSLGTLFCLVSFAVGVAALTDYLHQQDYLVNLVPKAKIHNAPFIGTASYNVFAMIFTAAILGLFLSVKLFGRRTSSTAGPMWRTCAIAAVVISLADALVLTVITATKVVSFGNVGPHVTDYMVEGAANEGIPLQYRDDHKALTTVVFSLACMELYFCKVYHVFRS